METITRPRPRKSVKIDNTLMKELKAFIKKSGTKYDAALKLNLTVPGLNYLLKNGSCKQQTHDNLTTQLIQ